MRCSRMLGWTTVLLLTLLTLAGCAPRPGAGEAASAAGPTDVVVDLPSIALDVAEDGSLSMAGIVLTDLVGSFGMPTAIALPPDLVQQLAGLGVQHIQIANQPDGLALLINGIEIPSIGWNSESLASVGALAGGMPALSGLLPILTQLGVGVTLNLPVAEGVERAPLAVSASATGAEQLAAAQQEFLAGVGTPPAITIPVIYNSDGTWTVAGLNGDQWIALTGQTFWSGFNLTPEQAQGAAAAGIKTFDVNIDADGLHLVLNDSPLPSFDWSGGKLASLIALLEQNGMLSSLPIPADQLDALLETLLPIVTSSNVNIRATFPAP